MRILLLTAILIGVTVPVAVSASPTTTPRVTPPPSNHWLSDGLNRLVFWQPPSSSHSPRPVHQ